MTEVNWLYYQVVYSDRVKLLTKFSKENAGATTPVGG
jgi:hypothetical protein